jgi:hypothetical protein
LPPPGPGLSGSLLVIIQQRGSQLESRDFFLKSLDFLLFLTKYLYRILHFGISSNRQLAAARHPES